MEKQFREILSEITGYTVTELADRQTEPLLQPYDCLLAMSKSLTIPDVVSSKNKPEIQQAHTALKAITAWRQLDGLNLLSDSEKYEIKERIMVLYGKYLSPIRTEQ